GKDAGQRGRFSRAGQVGGRTPITESLGRSALVKRSGEVMSVREATIIVALVNHPALIDENFAHVEFLDLANADLRKLHAVLLDAMAHDMANDRGAVIATVERAGCSDIWERAVGLIRKTRQWPALEQASLDDAREAFGQALHLHRSARTLHKELKQAESALATDPTDENYRHLIEIQAQFRDVQATEALVEGFGVTSGQAGRA
ncbi:MAG: DNA primase, partial [Mesorhizobium sp.]